MALSQTSLNLDILTVGTMFNRGSGLSTLDSYVPAVSSYGNVFYRWTNQPIASLYTGLFYGFSNDGPFYSSLSTIGGSNAQVSTTMYINIPILSTFSNINQSTLNSLSTIDISTVTSLGSILSSQSTLVYTRNIQVSRSFSSITPGVSTTVSTFYSTLFSPTASSFMATGYSNYVLSGSNPTPPRYIGPGISSLVTVFNDTTGTYPYYPNVNSNFPNILNRISSGVYASNSTINVYRSTFKATIDNAQYYIDGGSSISTIYWSTTNTFISSLALASTFPYYALDIYTYASTIIATTSVPTFRGFEIGSYISTASTTLTLNTAILATQLNSSMVSSVLLIPLSNFSTTALSNLTSTYLFFAQTDITPGLQILQSTFFSVINPFYLNLDVSTNSLGYQNISSMESLFFSTFSTAFPYILGTGPISSLSTLNSYISSLSTQITRDSSTLNATVQSYVTAPGISSMNSDLSTNTAMNLFSYNQSISSIYIPFSNACINVNSIPGICTLNSTVTNYDSTIRGISNEFPTLFSNYTAQGQSNSLALSTLSLFASNYTTQYTSSGILAYSTSYTTFANISSGILTNTNFLSSLLSPQGSIQESLDNLYTLETNVLDILIPFAGSTVYYTMLQTIPDYSTSINAIPPGGSAHDPYFLRSTSFSSVTTRTQVSYMSSLSVSNVGIHTSERSAFALDVLGNASIGQDPLNDGGIPSIKMDNFNVYTSEVLVSSVSTMILSAYFSSIVFNVNDLVIQRIYNNQRFGLVGINTSNPSYALDIGSGDARKPSGTAWITASDERVKANICNPEPSLVKSQISRLALVHFTWSPEFSKACGISAERTLGFLSQDVEKIFPMAVSKSLEPEHGYSEFMSLDTDQLIKAKFAVTQQLLHRVSSLEARIYVLMKEY